LTTLASLGFDAFFAAQLDALGRSDWVPARVASEGQSSYHLHGCRAPLGDLTGNLLRAGKLERPIVGDWVAVTDGVDRALIQHVLERRTALVRRAVATAAKPQIIAVNVDVFFVVTSANRDFNERRLERYVAAVLNSGAEPVIVLNKTDLQADLTELLDAIERVAIGVPVIRASAVSGEGLDALRERITPGRTVGFIGSSGVGKSTLMNLLLGRQLQAVGGLRGDDRGRHTTTARLLVELPGGGVLVDTPGMRELGLLDDAGGVDASFPDVIALAQGCRFRDCTHETEPGCAVQAALASGALAADRFASYRKLLREIAAAERARDPILAGRSKQRWKAIHKGLRDRAKIDPKLKR
jgi:ribosome biogenesis GTPase